MGLDYFDKLAEASVKEAIQQLVAAGKRPSARTVANDARQLLRLKGRGRLTEIDAERRVQQAVERLRERKEIKAPKTPNADWALIGHDPKGTES
jgi:Arc/MetJ-type ribon-helix-helix transcriptional regulator